MGEWGCGKDFREIGNLTVMKIDCTKSYLATTKKSLKKEKGCTEDKETHACDVIWCRVKMRKAMTEDELEPWKNDDIHYCHLGKFL